MHRRQGLILLISVLIIKFLTSCSSYNSKHEKQLTIFHAGSLAMPMKAMADTFMKENPSCQIFMESAGSRECAKKITELNKNCDLIITSDYQVIKEMLIPDYTKWYIVFAGNEMCIAYTDKSNEAGRINAQNWTDILSRNNITTGRSDPSNDPCGYRTLMLFRLAEKFYGKKGFAHKMEKKDKEYMRPKEVDLIALLESNALDYIFIYRSVAVQHHLKHILLPPAINLGKKEFESGYASAVVELNDHVTHKKTLLKGEPILYAFSIPDNAVNKDGALKFAGLILSEKGRQVMEAMGQNVIIATDSTMILYIPENLKKYILK